MSAADTSNLTLGKAKEQACGAVDLLVSHSVAPNPINFAVAYEYLGGSNAALNEVLEAHLGAGKGLDDFLLREIYDEHIASEMFQHFLGMRDDLQNILQSLLKALGDVGSGVTEYGEILERNITRLSRTNDPNELQAVAADLLAAAVSAQSRSQLLQQHLEQASRETEQLRQELEQQRRAASVDPLTGLLNRRAMERHLETLFSAEEPQRLAMLVLDIDHFKSFNDNFGHAIGDVVIRHVASAVQKLIRSEDIAVRVGGEEFVVLLPGTDIDQAADLAETIRGHVALLRLVRRQDNFTLPPFTISVGVAERRPGETSERLFERADQALYRSKREGRNRVTRESLN